MHYVLSGSFSGGTAEHVGQSPRTVRHVEPLRAERFQFPPGEVHGRSGYVKYVMYVTCFSYVTYATYATYVTYVTHIVDVTYFTQRCVTLCDVM